VYDGKPKSASVAEGDPEKGDPSVVTTLEDHGLAVGSSFQFSELRDFSGIENDTTYYVQSAPTAKTFTFSLTPEGPAVTDAFAIGGEVTLPNDLSGPDGAVWGAEIFGALAVPLLRSESFSQISGGFTPNRILMTTAGSATNTNAPV